MSQKETILKSIIMHYFTSKLTFLYNYVDSWNDYFPQINQL